jgi:hypothetical protein
LGRASVDLDYGCVVLDTVLRTIGRGIESLYTAFVRGLPIWPYAVSLIGVGDVSGDFRIKVRVQIIHETSSSKLPRFRTDMNARGEKLFMPFYFKSNIWIAIDIFQLR